MGILQPGGDVFVADAHVPKFYNIIINKKIIFRTMSAKRQEKERRSFFSSCYIAACAMVGSLFLYLFFLHRAPFDGRTA